ncbi:MAG: nickel-dependent hydrogenase large subunit [Sulfuricurvum sp.]
MITHELIERIEGEAVIDFRSDKSGSIQEATIRFLHFRGMEAILENRPALDALVITPRVCGICGHSHLIAAARMLESVYKNRKIKISLSPKAEKIREITRICEILQNHLKWLYLVMLQESAKIVGSEPPGALKALYISSKINQIAALFSGQWPHSSYALPGGVTCDPTHIEVMQALSLLSEVERFVEEEVLGSRSERFSEKMEPNDLLSLKGDFGTLLRNFEQLELLDQGRSHGRFLVLGEHNSTLSSYITDSKKADSDFSLVHEDDSRTFARGGTTYAKNALYDGEFVETGPLARALALARPTVRELFSRYGDCAFTRITARMDEVVYLTAHVRSLLSTLELREASFFVPPPIENLSGEGIGIVEAPRGSLIHKARIEKGKIMEYTIITPTQWNLGNGTAQSPGIAQKAMIGIGGIAKASLIFRTFDVCSVCTTH